MVNKMLKNKYFWITIGVFLLIFIIELVVGIQYYNIFVKKDKEIENYKIEVKKLIEENKQLINDNDNLIKNIEKKAIKNNIEIKKIKEDKKNRDNIANEIFRE